MNKIAIISTGGIGDQTFSFVAAEILRRNNVDYTLFCIARDEVFEVINELFKTYNPIQLPESLADNIFNLLRNGGDPEIDRIKSLYSTVYCVWPDEFSTSEFRFPHEKYGYTLQRMREIRLLTDKWKPINQIGVFLNSSTPEYQVKEPEEIVKQIDIQNDFKWIYYPVISEWAGKKLDYFNLDKMSQLTGSIRVDYNPSFLRSIEELRICEYAICVDNGISHLAHHFGIPTLLLDNRMALESFAWCRWRYNYHNSIPQDTRPELIAAIVRENLACEQSQLLPRQWVAQILNFTNCNPVNWKQLLFLKDF
jgi:hypothetical protein